MTLSHEPSTSSLALSDIIHTTSPSPTPPGPSSSQSFDTPSDVTSRERSESPEPLQIEELANFRARIEEMGIMSEDNGSLTPRERELSAMILRLIEAPRPDPSQLVQQATLIADLKAQRDFLTQRIVDERARMESERDGWERAVEALISQHQRSGKSVYYSRQDELERQCVALQQDNRELRDREQETHARLSCLEGELYRLKPLLVMNPQVAYTTLTSTSTYMSGLPYPSATGAVALKESKDKMIKKRKREKEAKESKVPLSQTPEEASRNGSGASDPPENQQQSAAGPSNSASKPNIPQSASSLLQDTQRSSAPSIYQHLLRKPQTRNQAESSNSAVSSQKLKQRSKSPKRYTSVTSDARSEHYLLAARKIGRERAGIVTGLVNAKSERDQERHRQAKEEMEKERQAAGFTGYYRNVTGASYTNNNAKKGKGKAPGTSNPPPKPSATSPSALPSHYPTTPNSGTNKNTSPRTPTPKRMSTGSIPGVQLFQHPGSPHGATYMFVPNPGLIGYPHAHIQTPPGAIRMPIITSPLAAASPTVGSAKSTVSQQPSNAAAQSSRQAGQPGPSQSRKITGSDNATVASVADSINQSLDSSTASSSSAVSPQPKTPLASLLSAAQSMMEDGSGGGGKSGKRKNSTQPESPTSKRRKTNSANASAGNVRNLGKRVRSALDVLADQAAAFSQDEQPGSSSQRTESTAKDDSATVGTRRSSRPNKGKRKEALIDVRPPRMISPAGSISRRGSTPRMIVPPDSQRSSESALQSQSVGDSISLLPPPVIRTSSSSIPPIPFIVTETSAAATPVPPPPRPTENGEVIPDADRVRDTVVPPSDDGSPDKDGESIATASTAIEASSSSPIPVAAVETPAPTAPKASDDTPITSTESSVPQSDAMPDQEKAKSIRAADKDRRSQLTDGEADSDADGDADPDVDMESSVI